MHTKLIQNECKIIKNNGMQPKTGIFSKEFEEGMKEFIKEYVKKECSAQPTPQCKEESKFLTRKEVAALLKVCGQTVINYTNQGLLQCKKIGRHVLYEKQMVEQAIKEKKIYRFKRNN